MSLSDKLRAMLDERGIEHKDNDTPINGVKNYMTTWHCTNGKLVSFIETEIPHTTKLRIYNPTTEQAIAATVGGYGITFAPTLDRPPETMVGETVYDSEGNAIGWIVNATVGMGTCQIEERHGDWYCTGCGEMVGTCDTASELFIDGNAIELWRHCPNCGKEIVK